MNEADFYGDFESSAGILGSMSEANYYDNRGFNNSDTHCCAKGPWE